MTNSRSVYPYSYVTGAGTMDERTRLPSKDSERSSREPAAQKGNRRRNRFCDACHLEVYPTNWMRHQRSRTHREAADYALDTSSRRRQRSETRSALSVGPSSTNSFVSSDGSPTRTIPQIVTLREMQRCAALVFGSAADTYEEFCNAARRLVPDIPPFVRQCMAAAAEMFAAGLRNAARSSSPPRLSSRRDSVDRATDTPMWSYPFRRGNSCPPRIGGSSIDASVKQLHVKNTVAEASPPPPPHQVEELPRSLPPSFEPYAQEPETAFGPLFADLTGLDSPFSRVEVESSPEKAPRSTLNTYDTVRVAAPPSDINERHPNIPTVSSLPDKQPVVALFRIPTKRKRSESDTEPQSSSLVVNGKESLIDTPTTETIKWNKRRQHAEAEVARASALAASADAEVARAPTISACNEARRLRAIGKTPVQPSLSPELPTLDERIAEILGDEPPSAAKSTTKSTEVSVVASLVPLQAPKRLPAPPTPWRQSSFQDNRMSQYQSFGRVRTPAAATISVANEDRSAPGMAVERTSVNSEASTLSIQQLIQMTLAQATITGVTIPPAVAEFMSAMNPTFQVPSSPETVSRRSSRWRDL